MPESHFRIVAQPITALLTMYASVACSYAHVYLIRVPRASLPDMRVSPRSSSVKDINRPKVDGMVPLSLEWCISKVCNRDSKLMSEGIVPAVETHVQENGVVPVVGV